MGVKRGAAEMAEGGGEGAEQREGLTREGKSGRVNASAPHSNSLHPELQRCKRCEFEKPTDCEWNGACVALKSRLFD